MQDELEHITRMVYALSTARRATEAHCQAWRALAETETSRIKKAFVKVAFGTTKEKRVEYYIQFHQTTLVELADRLLPLLEPGALTLRKRNTNTPGHIETARYVYSQLEELLAYIERHFTKYFNLAAKSPESYRFMVHRDLTHRLPRIRYALEMRQVNKRLLKTMLAPLDNFVEAIRQHEVSYQRIIYLRGLLAEAERLADSRLTGYRLDYRVCLSLGYLNFNTARFTQYCTREITRVVLEQPTLSKQLEKLAFMLKIVNQVNVKPGFAYNQEASSLKDQLAAWIGEEISFYEKRRQLAQTLTVNAEDPVQKDFRLTLNLSVAQLACLLRGLKEIGVIRNNNMLEVIRVVAGMVQTKNTEKVSWDSLRTRFYNTEASAREGVKALALALFNYTRKPGK